MPAACDRSRSSCRRGRCSIRSWPAAVVAGNVETSQCIVDALYGALGLQAASQGTMNNFTFGNERYQYYETIARRRGRRARLRRRERRADAHDELAAHRPRGAREPLSRCCCGGSRSAQARVATGDTAAATASCGTIEFREPMTAAILSNHRRVAPFGCRRRPARRTGRQPVCCAATARSELLAATAEIAVEPGDVISIETPGGGGFGRSRSTSVVESASGPAGWVGSALTASSISRRSRAREIRAPAP